MDEPLFAQFPTLLPRVSENADDHRSASAEETSSTAAATVSEFAIAAATKCVVVEHTSTAKATYDGTSNSSWLVVGEREPV